MNTASGEPRVALVTGAARGIGLAIAKRFCAEGMKVVAIDVLDEVEGVAAELTAQGHSAFPALIDLGDLPTIEPFVEKLIGEHGHIDILVNNAGISPKHDGMRAPIDATALDEWRRVIDINLTACFLLTKATLPSMKERRWGRFVNIASQAGRTRSQVAGAHYAASKAGLIGFTRTLAGEAGTLGITANCIAPGRIDTPMASEAGAEVNQRFVSGIPVGRVGLPEEVAAAAAYLASDEAAFVTGVCLDLNGGHFMA